MPLEPTRKANENRKENLQNQLYFMLNDTLTSGISLKVQYKLEDTCNIVDILFEIHYIYIVRVS